MDSPHSSAMSTAMPVYQTLLSFFPLQFSEGAWCGGSGDETIRDQGFVIESLRVQSLWLLKKALPSREEPDISLSIMNSFHLTPLTSTVYYLFLLSSRYFYNSIFLFPRRAISHDITRVLLHGPWGYAVS